MIVDTCGMHALRICTVSVFCRLLCNVSALHLATWLRITFTFPYYHHGICLTFYTAHCYSRGAGRAATAIHVAVVYVEWLCFCISAQL